MPERARRILVFKRTNTAPHSTCSIVERHKGSPKRGDPTAVKITPSAFGTRMQSCH